MYEESIKVLEMPELGSISVCVYNENDGLFELGERINAAYPEAYMNGYNWDAVISSYVRSVDPELMAMVESDPEGGMYSGYMSYSPENVEHMKRFAAHIVSMVSDEAALMKFIADNRAEIPWD